LGARDDNAICDRKDLFFKRFQVRRIHESKIHLRVGELRYGVGTDPAIDFPDIDGNPFAKIIERLEFNNLVRHFEYGTGFIFTCKGGMAGSAYRILSRLVKGSSAQNIN
jgi:hypothetical protein